MGTLVFGCLWLVAFGDGDRKAYDGVGHGKDIGLHGVGGLRRCCCRPTPRVYPPVRGPSPGRRTGVLQVRQEARSGPCRRPPCHPVSRQRGVLPGPPSRVSPLACHKEERDSAPHHPLRVRPPPPPAPPSLPQTTTAQAWSRAPSVLDRAPS